MRVDEIFSHKKPKDPSTENKTIGLQKNKPFREEIFLGIFF